LGNADNLVFLFRMNLFFILVSILYIR